MKNRNIVKTLTLAGLINLGLISCSDKTDEYEAVTTREDSTTIGYIDENNNSKFEYVDFTKEGNIIRYTRGLLSDSLKTSLQEEYDSLRNLPKGKNNLSTL